MKPTVFALNTAAKLAEAGCTADGLKAAFAEAADDGIKSAKRAVRNGRMAAEDSFAALRLIFCLNASTTAFSRS